MIARIAAAAAVSVSIVAQENVPPLAIAKQGSFFVGGRDVRSDTLSTVPNFPPTGTITVDQVYVHYQVPVDVKGAPITLIHGCCLTGKTWETTPDGRMGWDEYFVRKGRAVYVVDQAARGRSAANPSVVESVKLGKMPPGELPAMFSAAHEAAWTAFRFGAEYPKTYAGLQFPVDAIGEFWKQMVLDWAPSLATPNPTVPALSQLARRLNGTVLVSHSQSGIYPFQAEAIDRTGIAAIVSIEPSACPDAAADVVPYTKVPTMVLWGDYIDRSERWAPRLKMCQAFAAAVNARGGRIENVELPKVGMRGNSHMLMQDRNSLAVADWLLAWLDRQVVQKP